jgi:hypothetical protein
VVSLLCPALRSQLPAVLLHMRRDLDGIDVLARTKDGVPGRAYERGDPGRPRDERSGAAMVRSLVCGAQPAASGDQLAAREVVPSW